MPTNRTESNGQLTKYGKPVHKLKSLFNSLFGLPSFQSLGMSTERTITLNKEESAHKSYKNIAAPLRKDMKCPVTDWHHFSIRFIISLRFNHLVCRLSLCVDPWGHTSKNWGFVCTNRTKICRSVEKRYEVPINRLTSFFGSLYHFPLFQSVGVSTELLCQPWGHTFE